MTTDDLDWIFDDLFHGCAWQAYLEQAALTGGPPESDVTRRQAHDIFEQALAEPHLTVRRGEM